MPDERPHSRACGAKVHEHGVECSENCPTCAGRALTEVWPASSIHEILAQDLTEVWMRLAALESTQDSIRSGVETALVQTAYELLGERHAKSPGWEAKARRWMSAAQALRDSR